MSHSNNTYETEKLVNEYLLFHYGSNNDILPWDFGPRDALDFPARIVAHFSKLHDLNHSRALDIGCAVGRSSYELSSDYSEVIGIDYSHAFIKAAQSIGQEKATRIPRHLEAHLSDEITVKLPSSAQPKKVHFEQGDAMNLRSDLGQFDRVLAANLLCRLPEPIKFLKRLPDLVATGGELIITTPATWLEEYTPKENWPTRETIDLLKEHLSIHFDLKMEQAEPFLIRETQRKFQWTVAHLSKWQRK